jgi:pimeloyl-ACP methyl ester carboxylesterase
MTANNLEVVLPSTHRQDIWFDADGTRLYSLSAGSGAPVVFLHGGLADHRAALSRVGELASTHWLLTPDLRGSGRSIHAGALSWDRLADDLVALLDHVGVERAVVGGTSMGSAVALRFALRHPQRLQGLILMSPLYPGADRPLSDAAIVAMQTMKEAGERALSQGIEALRPLFDALPPAIRDRAMQMMLGFDAPSVAATTRFLALDQQPMESARDLESIEVKVMVLPGIDPQHPFEVAALYQEHLRRAVVVEQTAPDMMKRLVEFCSGPEG